MESLISFLPIPSSSGSWLDIALDITLRATLALAAAVLVDAGLRRASASVRHLVWCLGLAGALAVLPLAIALPRWELPILSRSAQPSASKSTSTSMMRQVDPWDNIELFTLGRSAYSEADIREAARAFTGWTPEGGRRTPDDANPRFAFEEQAHDGGPKTFLGRTGKSIGSRPGVSCPSGAGLGWIGSC